MGISVKIIEQNKERCEELSVLLPDAIIINGDGTDQELLREEGIEYAESFIPLTGIDEENVMLTLYAKQISNAKILIKTVTKELNSYIHPKSIKNIRLIYEENITNEVPYILDDIEDLVFHN